MSEIKVGEYVRTKGGYIAKVIKTGRFTCVDTKLEYIADDNDIVKHSPNIIDLIEEGDYVNGERVICFRNENCNYDIGVQYYDDYGEYFGFNKEKIKTIVTKERFAESEYKVNE